MLILDVEIIGKLVDDKLWVLKYYENLMNCLGMLMMMYIVILVLLK